MRSWISRINDFWSKCGSRSKKAIREAESVLSDGFLYFQGFLLFFFSPFPCFPYSASLTLFFLPCFSCPVSLPYFSCPVSFALFFLPCLFCPVSLALFLSCAKIFAKKKGNLML